MLAISRLLKILNKIPRKEEKLKTQKSVYIKYLKKELMNTTIELKFPKLLLT